MLNAIFAQAAAETMEGLVLNQGVQAAVSGLEPLFQEADFGNKSPDAPEKGVVAPQNLAR